jgi:hypothetical protein
VRARLRRRDSDKAAEAGGRLERELEQLRALTDAVATKAEDTIDRLTKIAEENRA